MKFIFVVRKFFLKFSAAKRRYSSVSVFLACMLSLLALLPSSLQAAELDFGLPIFSVEELRLEKTKTPDFNLSLLKKYLSEQSNNILAQLHAISQWITLMKLSDTPRTAELERMASSFLAVQDFNADKKAEGLRYIYFRGLLLASKHDDDKQNTADRDFEELLLKAEKVFSQTPEYHLIKGILFHLLRNRPNGYFAPMKPFEDLKRAAASAPSDPHFYYVLGQAFKLLGSDEPSLFLAVASFEKSASLARDNAKLQHTLLGIYMALHEEYQTREKEEPFWLQEAVYKKILSLSPNNPYALNNLGFLYAEYGVHRELAQSLTQKAVDQVPDHPGFRDSLGWAAFKNSQFDKAIQELEKAVSMAPEVYEPNYHLGTVYYVTKQFDKAVKYYEKAVALRPNSAEALNNYAYLLSEMNRDLEKAEKMAERAVKLEPNNPSYIDTYGWVLFKRGNTEDAMHLLHKAADLAPDVGEILMHLGLLNMESKHFDKALEYLKKAWKADPNLENIRDELYKAIVLNAEFKALADYHGLLGAKADSECIKRILLRLVRIFQEENMFEHAIEMTKLCEQAKKGTLDLSKPLFDFYSIENASETAATASALENQTPEATDERTPEISIEESAASDDIELPSEEKTSAEPTFPTVASVPLALHIGPAATSFAAKHLCAFSDFNKLSIVMFVERLKRPARHLTILLTYPGLEKHNALEALRSYLELLTFNKIDISAKISGFQAIKTRLGKKHIWAFQAGDHFFIGTGSEPSAADIILMKATFPYRKDALFGLLLDWRLCTRDIPKFLQPWIKNPMAPFVALYARHCVNEEDIIENTILLPIEATGQKLMKCLADFANSFKQRMACHGIETVVKISANSACVELEADYKNFIPWLEKRVKMWSSLLPFIKPYFSDFHCTTRRCLFGRNPLDLSGLCPGGGTVTIDGISGTLKCSEHPQYNVFPAIADAKDRCAFTRARLESIFKEFTSKDIKELSEDLIQKLMMVYNLPLCPSNGRYSVGRDGKLVCSEHSEKSDIVK